MAGDRLAYQQFLNAITPYVRSIAWRECERHAGLTNDAENMVQEALLAIHLKRTTWDISHPIGPWLAAIVRNKIRDSLRRRGRRSNLSMQDVVMTLEAEGRNDEMDALEADRIINSLDGARREIVQSIAILGDEIWETATQLNMSEGAVRVELHRALRTIAARYWNRIPES